MGTGSNQFGTVTMLGPVLGWHVSAFFGEKSTHFVYIKE